MRCVKGPVGDGKIGGGILGISDDIGFTGAVHGDSQTLVFAVAAEEGGVVERRPVGRQNRHESVKIALEGPLEGRAGEGEVRIGRSRYLGSAAAVHGDAETLIFLSVHVAAEEGGVNEVRSRGVELRHKGISGVHGEGFLKGPARGWKLVLVLVRQGRSRYVDGAVIREEAAGVQGDAISGIKVTAAEVMWKR